MRRAIKTCKHNSIVATDAPSIRLTFDPVVKVHVTDFPVVKVRVDMARIWQHKLCGTLSAKTLWLP